TNGVWTFEGTYEDGRFITLRCNYADGAATDITMKQKVKACMARTMGKTLSVTCN
ncbi:STY0301 family protein, partial [Acinetobacter baumannii]